MKVSPHEYERMKPMLWAMFCNGALSRGNPAPEAAKVADQAVAEFETRFPVEPEAEEE